MLLSSSLHHTLLIEEQIIIQKNKRLTRIEGRLDKLENQMSNISNKLQTDISQILGLLEKRAMTSSYKSSGLARPIAVDSR